MVCLQESWRKGRVVVRGEEKPYIIVTVYFDRRLRRRYWIGKEKDRFKYGEESK